MKFSFRFWGFCLFGGLGWVGGEGGGVCWIFLLGGGGGVGGGEYEFINEQNKELSLLMVSMHCVIISSC